MVPLEPSTSRKGTCCDNAVAESFFGSWKKEPATKQIYKTRELARADLADYIDTSHERSRRHSHLGGVSPEQFDTAHKPLRQGVHWTLGTPTSSGRATKIAESPSQRAYTAWKT